jgi:hypothetical protein
MRASFVAMLLFAGASAYAAPPAQKQHLVEKYYLGEPDHAHPTQKMKVYRGFTVEPRQIEMSGIEGSSDTRSEGSAWWVAPAHSVAMTYARPTKPGFSTIMELEVPVDKYWPAIDRQHAGYGVLFGNELRSMKPFIKRIGLQRAVMKENELTSAHEFGFTSPGATMSTDGPRFAIQPLRLMTGVRWFTPEEAQARGVLDKNADYEKIYAHAPNHADEIADK